MWTKSVMKRNHGLRVINFYTFLILSTFSPRADERETFTPAQKLFLCSVSFDNVKLFEIFRCSRCATLMTDFGRARFFLTSLSTQWHWSNLVMWVLIIDITTFSLSQTWSVFPGINFGQSSIVILPQRQSSVYQTIWLVPRIFQIVMTNLPLYKLSYLRLFAGCQTPSFSSRTMFFFSCLPRSDFHNYSL